MATKNNLFVWQLRSITLFGLALWLMTGDARCIGLHQDIGGEIEVIELRQGLCWKKFIQEGLPVTDPYRFMKV